MEKPKPNQLMENFSLTSLSSDYRLELKGEAAEIDSEGKTSLKKPSLNLSEGNKIIEITTGPKGRAEIFFNPQTQKMDKFWAEGEVEVIQKNKVSGEIELKANCHKLTFLEEKRLLILEGSPVLARQDNKFEGDRIYYFLDRNNLTIEGNARGTLYYEQKNEK